MNTLFSHIKQTINQAGGRISFYEFMHHALYAPSLGYYSAGSRKFGAEGDFITAPEISPLFSHCIARQCQQVLAAIENGVILEFGAGSGIMAADILQELEQLDSLPKKYLILEISADLQQRQRATLEKQVPHLIDRIEWLQQLPATTLQGVILANEVLDAMPVHRFRLDEQGISEFYVTVEESEFKWQILPTENEELREEVEKLRPNLPIGYISEINLALPAWIQSLPLATGLVLLIDYGFPSSEYYHPQRNEGTLMCHYRHQTHDNPLINVGLQDITTHVNFTTVGKAAIAANLKVAGYTNQANFLLASGLAPTIDPNDTKAYLQQAQQIKTLTLPNEMGELFKVMALTANFDIQLN
ncbi:class I SAM-dependent methyltransferase [Candidatus Marithrix sp. Canyon 246]|uniref:class I SAM-dependent methyltransferase n=3 Tax=Candidatus Marithrix sp. Canyon 246 TaxID=1827136 RepID=UPI00084A2B63|nr:SAM-dependent methyltransferase [Candidatus Marithrix sp. Canyon 246]